MQRKFSIAIHYPGTMAAALNFRWKVPTGCKLVHVSAVASNATDTTMTVGTSVTANGFITAFQLGQSNVPVEKQALADFDGSIADGQFPQLSDGDILVVATDISGSTDAADATIVLTFVEGGS